MGKLARYPEIKKGMILAVVLIASRNQPIVKILSHGIAKPFRLKSRAEARLL
jgi:hypothetical protein